MKAEQGERPYKLHLLTGDFARTMLIGRTPDGGVTSETPATAVQHWFPGIENSWSITTPVSRRPGHQCMTMATSSII